MLISSASYSVLKDFSGNIAGKLLKDLLMLESVEDLIEIELYYDNNKIIDYKLVNLIKIGDYMEDDSIDTSNHIIVDEAIYALYTWNVKPTLLEKSPVVSGPLDDASWTGQYLLSIEGQPVAVVLNDDYYLIDKSLRISSSLDSQGVKHFWAEKLSLFRDEKVYKKSL